MSRPSPSATDEYGGRRVRLDATLGSAELRLQVDVGFGDAVVPAPEDTSFPPLLDFPAPEVWSYSRSPVVAEKLHGLVTLGIANSRMKDFYDLWYLSREFSFEGPTLTEAIQSTFDRRGTPLPSSQPQALTDTFAGDDHKQRQWTAFLDRTQLENDDTDLAAVIDLLNCFVWPPLNASRRDRQFRRRWPPGGPWADSDSS